MRIGLCGYGVMGKNHERVFKKLNVESIDIYDPMIDRFSDWNGFLGESSNFDGVSICSPTKFHVGPAIDLWNANKNLKILIEKPISYSIEEAKRLEKFSDKLVVGHIERCNPIIIKLKELYSNGDLGDIFSIKTVRNGPPPVRYMNDNVAIDLLVHDVDVVNYILGMYPTNIDRRYKSSSNSEIIDYAILIADYANVNAIFESNWITPIKIRSIEITCTHGYLMCDYIKQSIEMYPIESNPFNIDVHKAETLHNELSLFLDFCRGKRVDLCGYVDSISCLSFVSGEPL